MTLRRTLPHTQGPVRLSYGELIVWSLALAFFGVFAAVPLREQTIVREQLPFPSGTATANVIKVGEHPSIHKCTLMQVQARCSL